MNKKNFETLAIHEGIETSSHKENSIPVYLTSGFTFDDAERMRAAFADENQDNIYSRFSNPNSTEFEHKMAALEGTESGFATASGMAAVFASVMAFLKSGDHIISASAIFGSTHTLFSKYLPKWGITHSYCDVHKPEDWEKSILPNTKMMFIESPSNPGLDLVDLEWAGTFAKKHKLMLVVDNCFATPYIQQPAKYGATLVLHSATKYIDGQGRVLGGIVLGSKEHIKEVYLFCRNTGPSLSPFNAWILSKSLETLAIRMEKHSENAIKLAEFLEKHSEVESVKYPFLKSHAQFSIAKKQMRTGGGMVAFTIKGGIERGRKFLDALQMAVLTANLGDTKTIITHPASTTHSKLTEEERVLVGISPGLVRVSAGLENIEDIIADIDNALKYSK